MRTLELSVRIRPGGNTTLVMKFIEHLGSGRQYEARNREVENADEIAQFATMWILHGIVWRDTVVTEPLVIGPHTTGGAA